MDRDEYYVREEPDCPPCLDSGRAGRRRCASCNPSRLQRVWQRITWRVAWWRACRRLPHDEFPPF